MWNALHVFWLVTKKPNIWLRLLKKFVHDERHHINTDSVAAISETKPLLKMDTPTHLHTHVSRYNN